MLHGTTIVCQTSDRRAVQRGQRIQEMIKEFAGEKCTGRGNLRWLLWDGPAEHPLWDIDVILILPSSELRYPDRKGTREIYGGLTFLDLDNLLTKPFLTIASSKPPSPRRRKPVTQSTQSAIANLMQPPL